MSGGGTGDEVGSGADDGPADDGPADDGSDDDGSDDDGSDDGDPSDARYDLPALAEVNNGNFATSPVCATCHSNEAGSTAMRDGAGREVGAWDLWQASMMANSARDPFWWAMVTAEGLATPSRQAEIEGECTRCHAPNAGVRIDLYDDTAMSLEGLLAEDDRSHLGLDGVSCTTCHQIAPDDLGAEAADSGHIDLKTEGRIYGPHADPFTMPMAMHTGFTPEQSSHTSEAGMCRGCHTLTTHTLTAAGDPTGDTYAEQTPYLEWLASDFSTEAAEPSSEARTCQSCHMPTDDVDGNPITTRIARRPMGGDFPPVGPRSPFHRHVMVGGNTLLPAILRDHADELRPAASAAAFDATIEAARHQLQAQTGSVSLRGITRSGGELSVDVEVRSDAGHKFPTGFPSRRAWLALEVRDAKGDLVFRSGGFDEQGRLVDLDGTVLPSEELGGPIQPHRDEVTKPEQVQIYEDVMAGVDGEPVFRLLRAAGDYKDNRLLPRGWNASGPDAEAIAPVLGGSDADFMGGGDDVSYRIEVPAEGELTVRATLLYQPLSPRFAEELFAWDAEAIRAFERFYEAADRVPEVVATAETTVP